MLQNNAKVFAALGDETRLLIVSLLSDGRPRPIYELTEHTSMSRQAVSKHLKVLESSKLVVKRRAGRECKYELSQNGFGKAQDCLSLLASRWDDALRRLREQVEK